MNRRSNKSNDEISRFIKEELEAVPLPESLKKDSIVKMLKDDSIKEISRTETKDNKRGRYTIYIRRLTAVAAMLIVVVGAALFMRADKGLQIIKTDSFYEGYEADAPVRSASSLEEIDRAVRDIILGKKGSSEASQSASNAQTTKQNKSVSVTANQNKASQSNVLSDNYAGYLESVRLGDYEKYAEGFKNGTVTAVSENGENREQQADVIKTDGTYIYIAASGLNDINDASVIKLMIIKTKSEGEMQTVSETVISNGSSADTVDRVSEIYINDNILTVILDRRSYSMAADAAIDKASTVAYFYNISDVSSPVKIKEHEQDGKYISSRIYSGKLCIASETALSSAMLDEKGQPNGSLIPQVTEDSVKSSVTAEEIFIAVNDPEASFLLITATDLSELSIPVSKLAVLGSGGKVCFGSGSVMISRGFVSVQNGLEGSLTEIYRIAPGDNGISIAGSYVLEGLVIGEPFDEAGDGYIRIASRTTNAYNIYILNNNLEYVSSIKGAFSGQKIRSIGFYANKGYAVSGENGEKTVMIDLSDIRNPRIAGTLCENRSFGEIFFVTDELAVCIEQTEASESSDKAAAVCLFDVKNPDDPIFLSEYKLYGELDLSSCSDGRSVMICPDEMLFGVPVIKNGTANVYTYSYIVFDIGDFSIKPVGTYIHSNSSESGASIGSVYANGILYTVSGEKVSAFSLKDNVKLSAIYLT